MGERQESPQSNPPVKNILVVSAIILVSAFVGLWGAIEFTNSLGTVTTWMQIGIGLAAVYLLYDIANSVKELEYRS
ncbi:Mn2+/Fe2+ transporter [Halosolutus gelatinilyticus]|uniref:Mn2+/Fe2+ transporter n=1 Tax=Halosolutus gelatinilyticus TaxID=2931975 RepID=UPI001FF425FC|nr:Mn2+/Fe2+ transporter [Halosolutus gelatinilyticus]